MSEAMESFPSPTAPTIVLAKEEPDPVTFPFTTPVVEMVPLVRRATWSERLQWLIAWLFYGNRFATPDEAALQRRHGAELAEVRRAAAIETRDLRSEISAHLMTIDDRERELRDVRTDLALSTNENIVLKGNVQQLLEVNERDRARVSAEKAEAVLRRAKAEQGKSPKAQP